MQPTFYAYPHAALNHSWLRGCAGFGDLFQGATNERLAEVRFSEQLEASPRRTTNPLSADLFVVLVWEVVSGKLGACQGTTHASRMERAAEALKASAHFRRAPDRHVLVSTGVREPLDGRRPHLRERLGPLGPLLKAAIVGRDRAYSPDQDRASGVGRCVVEVPYCSNPNAFSLRMEPESRNSISAPRTILRASSRHHQKHEQQHHHHHHLLSYQGSHGACCPPGKWIRSHLWEKLWGRTGVALQLRARPRHGRANATGAAAAALDDPLVGRRAYEEQGAAMRRSTFCLIPAGDTEVTSRLYSAIAAGCVPVVLSDRLSGAFACARPGRTWSHTPAPAKCLLDSASRNGVPVMGCSWHTCMHTDARTLTRTRKCTRTLAHAPCAPTHPHTHAHTHARTHART